MLWNALGVRKARLFREISRRSRFDKFPRVCGNVASLLKLIFSLLREISSPNSAGTSMMSLYDKFSFNKLVRRLIAGGIVKILLLLKFRAVSDTR
jgi:hypothetical protein